MSNQRKKNSRKDIDSPHRRGFMNEFILILTVSLVLSQTLAFYPNNKVVYELPKDVVYLRYTGLKSGKKVYLGYQSDLTEFVLVEPSSASALPFYKYTGTGIFGTPTVEIRHISYNEMHQELIVIDELGVAKIAAYDGSEFGPRALTTNLNFYTAPPEHDNVGDGVKKCFQF